MMVIRPVQGSDCDLLMALAELSGVGFTSLPQHQASLNERIARMIATWQGKAEKQDEGFLFVLEDTETKKAVGVSGIEVAIGLCDPWYHYRVGTLVHASRELGVHTTMPTLFLSNDHTGNSELCTLFLHPDYRHSRNGHFLSKARLLFIATFQSLFTSKIIAEMRGYSDQHGQSPFWESLGRHFFTFDFAKADYLTGIGQKAFIAELMPKHPLYIDFLGQEAKDAIAKVHPNTEPARKILESEGMRYEGYVDIFDGGPTLEAYVRDLRIVKDHLSYQVVIEEQVSAGEAEMLVGNTSFQDYRAIKATPLIKGHRLYLSAKQAKALSVQTGDEVKAVSLFAQEKTHAAA
ncbi:MULTISPECIES: arginine N-succinyltransferase [unclassified Vibrio]|uniref:Arginine N-succinyltransferase n=1 Tax=Vibrio sp. HB236076 TaxID=3232307 RepID=A0AB39HKQ7_9VIBR|nr:arginine N-succinyltransferase [Vibrio sp. HB161653]MDP5252674.1 arginine N-succinyltransferase [Vibrio sp. HB161653]